MLLFQGERKTYFQNPDSLIKRSIQWHLEKTGSDISVLPWNKQPSFHQCNNNVNQEYSLQSIINEQPDPAKPNSNGFKAWFPCAAAQWANVTEIKLMNWTAQHTEQQIKLCWRLYYTCDSQRINFGKLYYVSVCVFF